MSIKPIAIGTHIRFANEPTVWIVSSGEKKSSNTGDRYQEIVELYYEESWTDTFQLTNFEMKNIHILTDEEKFQLALER